MPNVIRYNLFIHAYATDNQTMFSFQLTLFSQLKVFRMWCDDWLFSLPMTSEILYFGEIASLYADDLYQILSSRSQR